MWTFVSLDVPLVAGLAPMDWPPSLLLRHGRRALTTQADPANAANVAGCMHRVGPSLGTQIHRRLAQCPNLLQRCRLYADALRPARRLRATGARGCGCFCVPSAQCRGAGSDRRSDVRRCVGRVFLAWPIFIITLHRISTASSCPAFFSCVNFPLLLITRLRALITYPPTLLALASLLFVSPPTAST